MIIKMACEIERLKNEIDIANESLATVMEELQATKHMLDRAKRGEIDLHTVHRIQDRKAEEEVSLRVRIIRMQALLRKHQQEAINASAQVLAQSTTQPSSSSLPAHPPPASSANCRQMTLRNFDFRITKDKEILPIHAPVFATEVCLTCDGCDKSFKTTEGLTEHRRHCIESKEISKHQLTEIAYLKRQKCTDEISRPRSASLNERDSRDEFDSKESSKERVDDHSVTNKHCGGCSSKGSTRTGLSKELHNSN